MNSFWNKNISLFKARFSFLAEQLEKTFPLNEQKEPEFAFWQVVISKNGELTAKENGIFLHSSYAPKKEAVSTVKNAKTEQTECAVFFSMGLGYAPLEWAKSFPEDSIIIVEPEPQYFFAALKYTDFEPLLKHKKLIVLLQAELHDVITLTEHSAPFSHTALIENKAQSQHSKEYFESLHFLFERNQQKEKINSSTLEKFSKLWLRNSCFNLPFLAILDGINIYKNVCPQNLPCLLIAAGPGLSEILPFLKELKKRCLTVAVDTALSACLKAEVEPDFIVLTDPQYYAYRHIAGLKSKSSVLITESAVCPAVYRFNCRKTVLCSSLFPLGQYFEEKLGHKGKLGSGGSVATTAWDFCRIIGAKEIYCAGLDLGYPKKNTHIRGSFFEEKAHFSSTRLNSAEKMLATSIFAANPVLGQDYEKNTIVTDSKMKMFAWWFESQTQKYPETTSFSLSKTSLKIPGFYCADVQTLLKQDEKISLRNKFFEAEKKSRKSDCGQQKLLQNFNAAFEELKNGLENLYSLARKAFFTCEKTISDKNLSTEKIQKALKSLEQTDFELRNSQFTQIASLVFPTEAKLNELFSSQVLPKDKTSAVFSRSKIVYEELMKSVRQYQQFLQKNDFFSKNTKVEFTKER